MSPVILDTLAKLAGFRKPAEEKSKGNCIACGDKAFPKCYSESGRAEYKISGICETCFDSMFKNEGHG